MTTTMPTEKQIESAYDREHPIVPLPGFFPDVPADTYHSWRAASKTLLCEMAPPQTPANLKWVLDNGPFARDCFRKGDAVHAIITEPHRFIEDYIVAGTCAANKGDGKPCTNNGIGIWDRRWLCGVHRPKGVPPTQELAVVSRDELEEFQLMRKSVREHPVAREILDAPGFIEASCVAVEPTTGELVKCRPDKIANMKRRVVADLKTTRDASPFGFGREVRKHKYLIQAGIYPVILQWARGEQAGDMPTDFVFIAVENHAPYLTATYKVSVEDRAAGFDRFIELLETYRECRETGVWNGYSKALEVLSVPPDFGAEPEVELSIGGSTFKL